MSQEPMTSKIGELVILNCKSHLRSLFAISTDLAIFLLFRSNHVILFFTHEDFWRFCRKRLMLTFEKRRMPSRTEAERTRRL